MKDKSICLKFNPFVIVFCMVYFTCSAAFAATLQVPTAEYPTIQSAIDAASHLDTVLVADGTYRGGGNKNLDFKGKAITVKSENGPSNCIIDCDGDGRGFYFHYGEGAASEVSGFTITDGSESYGGGIYVAGSSPTITNCTISGNAATETFYRSGGGVYVASGLPTFANCIISGNTAASGGGGICVNGGFPAFTNCTINSNTASGAGGGIYLQAPASFTDCVISSNFAASHGGGVYCWTSSAIFTACTISDNGANDVGSDGGGLYFYGSSTVTNVTNCTITGNTANDDGGGIYCYSASPTITNCTVSGNTVSSSGGGIYCDNSSPKIWNTIFWGDTPDEIYVNSSSPEVHYCDVQGGYSGSGGNIDSNPLFVGSGNYHLSSGSPCINTGTNIAPELPSEDKDGNSRTIDGTADMGAYEYEKLAPTVSTNSASSVTASTATLNGTVNPNGAITTYCFQYGTTTGYGSTTAHTNAGAGKSNVSASLSKSGLSPNTTYHFRIAARNFAGTTYGNDRSLTTSASSIAYVNKNDGTCGGKTPCYTSIQTAINATGTGSAVRVARGTYTESIALNASKSLILKGGWNSAFTSQAPNTTIIKAPKATKGSLTLQMVTIRP